MSIVGLAILMLASMSAAGSYINSTEELERLQITDQYVLEMAGVSFESPADLALAINGCACSLVEFSLSRGGSPNDARVERSVPDRILGRSALLAVKSSEFKAPAIDDAAGHLMLFVYCFDE